MAEGNRPMQVFHDLQATQSLHLLSKLVDNLLGEANTVHESAHADLFEICNISEGGKILIPLIFVLRKVQCFDLELGFAIILSVVDRSGEQ